MMRNNFEEKNQFSSNLLSLSFPDALFCMILWLNQYALMTNANSEEFLGMYSYSL